MTDDTPILEVVDASELEPGDLTALEWLRQAYRDGGMSALDKAMGDLTRNDPGRMLRVMDAVYPDM